MLEENTKKAQALLAGGTERTTDQISTQLIITFDEDEESVGEEAADEEGNRVRRRGDWGYLG